MKKPSSRIREEIAKLQDQLKQAETREAERIGRIALKAGLGELDIAEEDLQEAFEDVATRFRKGGGGKTKVATAQAAADATSNQAGEG